MRALPTDLELPTDLDTFYVTHPEFILGPTALALLLTIVPHGLPRWGFGAVQYVAFSVLLQFALHGWMCCYETVLRESKLQEESFDHGPKHVAARQTAVLLSNLLYVVLPLRPASSTWSCFVGSLVGLALLWDAYFFACLRAFHRNARLYRRLHKLHHTIRPPMCFSAYYVTYPSHLLTEQLVVVCASSLFVPRDVLIFYLYYALFETFLQHAGVDFDRLQVPLLPWLKIGHVRRLLSLYGLPFGSYTTAHHDWHHEKNCKNYALAFTYLDRLAGTHFIGRPVGGPAAALQTQTPPLPNCEPTASATSIATSTPEGEVKMPMVHSRQVSGG